MFWSEGLFVFPLMLAYTAVSYSVCKYPPAKPGL